LLALVPVFDNLHVACDTGEMDIVIKPAKDLVFPVALQAGIPKGKKEYMRKCSRCPCRDEVFCD
jgi:hypothetical protein